MLGLSITGDDDLHTLARRLQSEGQGKGLQREVNGNLKRAAHRLEVAAKAAARTQLPRSGGLGALVASATFTTSSVGSGVQIRATGQAVEATDLGFVRHPVFGRGRGVIQRVPAGWFTKTMQESVPTVRREVIDAARIVASRIARG